MAFINAQCNETLAADLGLPDSYWNFHPGYPTLSPKIVYDKASKVVLIARPFSHSCYPDRDFTLVIDGEAMTVWEFYGERNEPNKIEVWVHERIEHFDDAVLMGVAHSALAAFNGFATEAYDIPIEVRGRKPPARVPRRPEDVIAGLNKFVELEPPSSNELVAKLGAEVLMPVLIRDDELDAFVRYRRERGWIGLNSAAWDLFGEALKKLDSEH